MPLVLLYFLLLKVHSPVPGPAPLTLEFVNRHETKQIDVFNAQGGLRPEALRDMSRFVRCWRTERVKQMDPRLVQVISQISQHFGDAEILVVSGYRARPYG